MIYKHIEDKLKKDKRVTVEEAIELYKSQDLIEIAKLADFANKKKNQDNVFYNINRHINPTNICVNRCKFCAFSKK